LPRSVTAGELVVCCGGRGALIGVRVTASHPGRRVRGGEENAATDQQQQQQSVTASSAGMMNDHHHARDTG